MGWSIEDYGLLRHGTAVDLILPPPDHAESEPAILLLQRGHENMRRMAIFRILTNGNTRPPDDVASAEALAQAQSPKESVIVDVAWLWSPKEQRLAKDVDVFSLPTGGRVWAAKNAKTPAITLAKLAKDPESQVRAGVARNASALATTLAILAIDPDSYVRYWIARNAKTPASTLTHLANDPDSEVRMGVAINASTPSSTRAKLANDPEVEMRYEANAKRNYNPSLPVPRKP